MYGCWSESWAPPHCSREVRGLKERPRKVRTHSRIRERSTMPIATGGESGSSLTFKTGPQGWNTVWAFIALYFYISYMKNQTVRFKFKTIKSDRNKNRRELRSPQFTNDCSNIGALFLLPTKNRTCFEEQRQRDLLLKSSISTKENTLHDSISV